MFGFGGNTETKLQSLVKRGKFEKIRNKYLNADDETVIKLAKACAASNSDDSVNLVLALLERSDAVKLEALKTLSVIGTDHVKSTLQLMYSKTPDSDKELKKAILDTIHNISAK